MSMSALNANNNKKKKMKKKINRNKLYGIDRVANGTTFAVHKQHKEYGIKNAKRI